MLMKSSMVLSLLLALLAAAAPLRAEETDATADARRLYSAGRQAYEAGRFDEAATAFEDAYRLQPRPALLWNLAQSYRHQYESRHSLEALRKAVDHYRRYLAEATH